VTRPLSFEALEHRRLLSASVAVRYEFDSPGPVSSLTVGQNFDLKVFVQDVQSVPA
jgi:hypothetical protein